MIRTSDSPEHKAKVARRSEIDRIFYEELFPIMRQIPDEYMKAFAVLDQLSAVVADTTPFRVTANQARQALAEVKNPIVVKFLNAIIEYCDIEAAQWKGW